ncbi:hypothetical protein HC928_06210 [bacterium]|nr:hypothetical protein [bacterium]
MPVDLKPIDGFDRYTFTMRQVTGWADYLYIRVEQGAQIDAGNMWVQYPDSVQAQRFLFDGEMGTSRAYRVTAYGTYTFEAANDDPRHYRIFICRQVLNPTATPTSFVESVPFLPLSTCRYLQQPSWFDGPIELDADVLMESVGQFGGMGSAGRLFYWAPHVRRDLVVDAISGYFTVDDEVGLLRNPQLESLRSKATNEVYSFGIPQRITLLGFGPLSQDDSLGFPIWVDTVRFPEIPIPMLPVSGDMGSGYELAGGHVYTIHAIWLAGDRLVWCPPTEPTVTPTSSVTSTPFTPIPVPPTVVPGQCVVFNDTGRDFESTQYILNQAQNPQVFPLWSNNRGWPPNSTTFGSSFYYASVPAAFTRTHSLLVIRVWIFRAGG